EPLGPSFPCGLADAERPGDLGICWTEHVVGKRHLAWMDAALAEIAETVGRLRLLSEAVWVLDRGKGRVIGPDPGLHGGKPYLKLHLMDRRLVLAINAQWLQ